MSDDTKTASVTRSKATGSIAALEQVKIQQLFKLMVDNGGSDLHITPGTSPAMRVSGEIVRVKVGALTNQTSKELIYQVLTEEQKNEFEKNLELDFSFGIKNLSLIHI